MCNACDVYEFSAPFPGAGGRGKEAHFKMTSVCGHVMSLDFPPRYNKWDQVDPVCVGWCVYKRVYYWCIEACLLCPVDKGSVYAKLKIPFLVLL